MVEVVGDAVVRLDEGEPEPLAGLELDAPVHALDRGAGGKRGERLLQVEDAQPDAREDAGVARPLGGEERELPRRASEPTSVNLSVRSIDVHAQCRR